MAEEKAKPAVPAASAATNSAALQTRPRSAPEAERPGPTAARVRESTVTAAQVRVTVRGEASVDTRTSSDQGWGMNGGREEPHTGNAGEEGIGRGDYV